MEENLSRIYNMPAFPIYLGPNSQMIYQFMTKISSILFNILCLIIDHCNTFVRLQFCTAELSWPVQNCGPAYFFMQELHNLKRIYVWAQQLFVKWVPFVCTLILSQGIQSIFNCKHNWRGPLEILHLHEKFHHHNSGSMQISHCAC